jgi:hypothetical protein
MHLDHGFGQARGRRCDPLAVLGPAHLNHRVEHGHDVQALAGDLAHHRIHQEGPVLTDHFKNIATQAASVRAMGGAHANQNLVRFAARSSPYRPEFLGQRDRPSSRLTLARSSASASPQTWSRKLSASAPISPNAGLKPAACGGQKGVSVKACLTLTTAFIIEGSWGGGRWTMFPEKAEHVLRSLLPHAPGSSRVLSG